MSILVAQDETSVSHLARLQPKAFVFVIFAWIWYCFILSNWYTGQLFSSMTFIPPLKIPDSIEKIVGQKLKIITLNYYYSQTTEKFKTQLTNIILPQMMKGTAGVDYPMYYQTLEKSVISPRYSAANKDFVTGWLNERKIYTNVKDMLFPETFCILSTLDKLTLLRSQFQSISNKALVFGPTANVFMTREAYFVTRNYFSKIFQFGMFSLSQSGIGDKVMEKMSTRRLVGSLKKVDELTKNITAGYGNIIRSRFFQFLESQKHVHEPQVETPIDLEIIYVVLALYGIGIIASFLAFCFEIARLKTRTTY